MLKKIWKNHFPFIPNYSPQNENLERESGRPKSSTLVLLFSFSKNPQIPSTFHHSHQPLNRTTISLPHSDLNRTASLTTTVSRLRLAQPLTINRTTFSPTLAITTLVLRFRRLQVRIPLSLTIYIDIVMYICVYIYIYKILLLYCCLL